MKILVLAGGYDQIALIKELQSRGHEVILVDYLDNPPAKHVVEKHYKVSTLDEAAVLNLAQKENVELITTACTDQALLTVARVSKALNLPCYIDDRTALNVTNKVFMKEQFHKYGIPTAQSMVVDKKDDLDKHVLENFRMPLVVKPCDCNSSKGVRKVNDFQELVIALDDALSLSRSKKAIIEEYLDGIEVSIDVWKDRQDAKILSISTSDKIQNNNNAFTIFRSKYPVSIGNTVFDEIKQIARKICEVFNLENCPVLIQAIINGNRVDVIEFSARMGGGSKYKLIEYMSGVDIMKVYVNRVLGEEQIVTPKYSKKLLELNYVYAKNGIYKEITGLEKLLNDKVISEIFIYKESGSVIEKHTTSSDRIFGFLVQSDDSEELESKRSKVLSSIDILDIEGNSMILKEVFDLY